MKSLNAGAGYGYQDITIKMSYAEAEKLMIELLSIDASGEHRGCLIEDFKQFDEKFWDSKFELENKGKLIKGTMLKKLFGLLDKYTNT